MYVSRVKTSIEMLVILYSLCWLPIQSIQTNPKQQSQQQPEKQIQLFHESIGRLGNQLFQYASMYGIAQQNHALLCVHPKYRWYMPYENHRINLAFQEFHQSFVGHELQSCSLPSNFDSISGDDNFLFDMPEFKRDTNVIGYLETFRYFAPSMRSKLRFNGNVLHEAQEYMSKFQNYTTVGIHVRFYETATMRISPAAYFDKAMSFMQHRYHNFHFIVTSDNIRQCAQMDIFSRPDVHLVEKQYMPVIDMAILAQCNHIIISTGSFGWWAAFLGADMHGGLVMYDKDGMGTYHWGAFNHTDYWFDHWLGM